MAQSDKNTELQILLIEKNPEIIEKIEQTIADSSEFPYQIHQTEKLANALVLLSSGPFDTVLLGLALQGTSGIDILKKILEAANTCPVIVFGSNEDIVYAQKIMAIGAQDYLTESSINTSILPRAIFMAIERNKKLQTILRSEKKFRTIIDNLQDAYYEVDLRGNYTYVNKPTAHRLGYTPESVIGMNNRKFTSPDMAKKTLAFYSEVYKTGIPGTMDDYEITDKDGSKSIIELSVSLLRDENGNPIGFNGISRNVTDKKMALKALKKSEEKYRNILANIEDGYFEVDLKGRLTFYNGALGNMFGCDDKELLLVNNQKYMDAKNAQKVYLAYNEIYKTGQANRSLQYDIIRFDGIKRYMESSVSIMKNEDNHIIGFQGIARDITKRKQAAIELAEAKERAEAADRSKSDFLANMSHEIRTPMNGVIGMYTLLQGTELTSEQIDFVETGKQSADSLLTVINDILDFSKIEAGKLDIETINFDLRKAIMDMIALPAMLAQNKKLEYIYQIDPEAPSLLMGDPGRLRQIIMNLSTNAIKFTQQGEVVFRIFLEEETNQEVTLRFSVQDTGIGISTADQARLFNSFQQVDASTTRKYGGTGLGLAISKQLSQLMGGNIGVESEKGQGATFWFTAIFKKQEQPPTTQRTVPEIIRGKRFLIVDDNQTNLKVLLGYFKMWECLCDTALSGQKALTLIQTAVEKKEPYDLVICDMLMPEINGAELGKHIKSDPILSDTHLIMLTSQGLRGDTKEMTKIGFAAYLTKPVGDSVLFDCIATVLGNTKKSNKPKKHPPIVTRHTLSEAKRQNVLILLVEDNIINRKLAIHLLNRFGFQAQEAVNGKEAIKALEKTRYDIVLMDIQMPEMDGLEATKIIRDSNSNVLNHNIPIIAMTAHAMIGDQEMCLTAGMNDYITKPIQPDAFLSAIEKQL